MPQEVIAAVQLEFLRLRQFLEQNPKPILSASSSSGENRTITMRDVYMFGGGLSMFYAVGKLMKWF